MPECQAYGCLNKRGEGNSKGKSFFVIPDGRKYPEKRELSQQWLHNIGTGHTVEKFSFGKHKLVCEDHFKPDCFKEDLQARLMGTVPKKILKEYAVPEIFVHRRPKDDSGRADRAAKRSAKRVSTACTFFPTRLWTNYANGPLTFLEISHTPNSTISAFRPFL